jgi:exonuclease SbcC
VRPRRLEFQGLRSWRERTEISFDGIGLFALLGNTGAGKSSILEAIFFALYGGATWKESSSKALITYGAPRMTVRLEFEADGRQYQVSRSVSSKAYPPGTHQLECFTTAERWDGDDPVTAKIVELIGLDAKGFKMAVILPQGKFSQLLCAKAAERTNLLKGLFGLDALEDVRILAADLRVGLRGPLGRAERLSQMYPSNARAELLEKQAAERDAKKRAETLTRSFASLANARKATDDSKARILEAESRSSDLQGADAIVISLRALVPLDEGLKSRQDALSLQMHEQQDVAGKTNAELGRLTDSGTDLKTLTRYLGLLESFKRHSETAATLQRQLSEEEKKFNAAQAKFLDRTHKSKAFVEKIDSAAKAKKASDTAVRSTRDLEQALQRYKERCSRVDELNKASAVREETIVKEANSLKTAALTAKTLSKAHAAAETARERAEQLDLAVALAAGLRPGQSCPVCAKVLSPNFKAPRAPNLSTLRVAEQKAAAALAAAEGELVAVKRTLARLELEQKRNKNEANEQVTALSKARMELISAVYLKRRVASDDDLEAEIKAQSAAAAQRFDEASTQLARLSASQVAEQQAIADDKERLAERKLEMLRLADLQKDEAVHRDTARNAIKPPFQPLIGADSKQLAKNRGLIETGLVHAQELDHKRERAQGDWQRLSTQQKAINDDRAASIDGQRKLQIGKMHAKVSVLSQSQKILKQSFDLPDPAKGVTLADDLQNANAILAACSSAISNLSTVSALANKDLLDAKHDVERVIASSGFPEDQMESELLNAKVALQACAERIRYLEDVIPKSDRLATLASPVSDLDRALAEIVSLLVPGKFFTFALEQRKTALLALASDMLQEMSKGKFGFTRDFQIVDNEWAGECDAEALSGGETFLASLALALALVEIAARSGGRLQAFFLDEGFSSLDQESLESAVQELEKHAGDGRIVGIISHLREVAERIPTIFHVEKTPLGSHLTIIGDMDREEFIEAGIERSLLS